MVLQRKRLYNHMINYMKSNLIPSINLIPFQIFQPVLDGYRNKCEFTIAEGPDGGRFSVCTAHIPPFTLYLIVLLVTGCLQMKVFLLSMLYVVMTHTDFNFFVTAKLIKLFSLKKYVSLYIMVPIPSYQSGDSFQIDGNGHRQ